MGSYVRTFTVPSDWKGGRVILHFGGVYSGHQVWVNGKEVIAAIKEYEKTVLSNR